MKNAITVLVIIYCSGYYLSTTVSGDIAGVGILMVYVALLSALYLLKSTSVVIRHNELLLLAVLICVVFLCDLIGIRSISFTSIRQSLVLITAYIIVRNTSWNTFKMYFVKTMIAMTVVAVIGYLLLLTPLQNQFPIIENYNGIKMESGIFFSQIINIYTGLSNRMQGAFWEPGLLASYISLAILFMEPAFFKKRSYYLSTFVFFVISILMTRSGAGLLLLPVVLITKFSESRGTTTGKISKTIAVLLFAAVIIIYCVESMMASDYLNQYLFNKVLDSNNVSNSSRLGSILIDLQLFAQFPFFGTGGGDYYSAIATYSGKMVSSGTSTLSGYLARYGICGMVFIFVWLKGFFQINKHCGFIVRFGTALSILMILTKEPHGGLLFMNCIFMYMLTNGYDEKGLYGCELHH